MWVFTQTGFVSAVRHRDDKTKLMVRGRDSESLEDLADMASVPIDHTPGGDYPYRVTVTDLQFMEWAEMQIETLDYTNFKSRVTITRGDVYHDACMDVWSAMHQVEDANARNRYATK
jgi:hypothetical protein